MDVPEKSPQSRPRGVIVPTNSTNVPTICPTTLLELYSQGIIRFGA